MAIRYKRLEETWADVQKASRRSERNANRPTGTEVNQTAQTVIEMVPVVADALEKAQKAIDDAADAVTTSNGKNSRRRGQTEPEPPPGGWTPGDQWIIDNADGVPYAVSVWNGTAFVPEQLLASELLVASGGGLVRLADGVVTADAVAADAIDGMLITGATIRTAPSGQRMQFDINGLSAYNAADTQTLSIQSASDGLVMRGDAENVISFSSYAGIRYNSNRVAGGAGRFILEPRGLSLTKNFDSSGPVIRLEHGVMPTDRARLTALNTGLTVESGGDMNIVGPGGGGKLTTQFDSVKMYGGLEVGSVRALLGVDTNEIRNDYEIVLDAPKVTFQGDTDWVNVAFMTGWQNNTSAPTQWRIKHGQLQISGRISRTNATAIGASYTQFSQPNSAIAAAVASLPNTTAITPGSGATQQGLLLINADGSMSCAAAGGVIFLPNATYLL